MKDTLGSLAVLILPTLVIFWAWKNRIRSAVSWRERLGLFVLTIVTADLAFCAVCLLWSFFGAKQGSGVTRWQLTADLVTCGFWVSAFALIAAIVCKAGTKGPVRARVGQKFVLILLSLAATLFWFAISIPVNDFYAVEAAREAASHAPQTK
jgi:hypothetical protein